MFEPDVYDQLRDSVAAVTDARTATALATCTQLCDAARLVQQAQDALDSVRVDLLSRIDDTKAFRDEGASTIATWMCRKLRIPIVHARSQVKAGRTLRALPDAAEAMSNGEIRLAHVYELSAGVTKVGVQAMVDAQHELLPLAKAADPVELRAAIDHLGNTLHPDGLDDDYAKGMDKSDVKLAKCGEGYHLSGFLDILTGAKVHAFLKTASAGYGDDDERTPAQRRTDALGSMADHAADSGTGVGTGIGGGRSGLRPQLHVIADLDTLLGVPGAEPARLAGFGPIGRDLLGYLTCTGDTTTILTDGVTTGDTPQAAVLNVGRTTRLATDKQRAAVIARQDGHCAAPGCGNTVLEIHHVAWWGRDHGTTDLHNLIGICSGCHHLVHRQKLTIQTDSEGGFTFRRSSGKKIDDHVRQTRTRIRRIIRRALHDNAADARRPSTRSAPPTKPTQRPTRPSHQQPRSAGERHLAHITQQRRPPMRT